MEIFGWIILALLAAFGIFILVLFTIPFIASESKALSYKIKKAIEDRKEDIDKRSEARKHRDEIKRQRDFELADKKLDAKLLKVDKQIELHNKKLKIANELKAATKTKKEELKQETAVKLAKPIIEEIKEEEIKEEEIKEEVQEPIYAIEEELVGVETNPITEE